MCGELRRIVIDISNPDHSGGCVGQAICGVSLHICSLDDQGVLGDFLEANRKQRKSANGNLNFSLNIDSGLFILSTGISYNTTYSYNGWCDQS